MIQFKATDLDVVKELENERTLVVTFKIFNKKIKQNNKTTASVRMLLYYRNASSTFVYGIRDGGRYDWMNYSDYLSFKDEKGSNWIKNFETKYKRECEGGVVPHKYIGELYPGDTKNIESRIFIRDKIRTTYPLSSKHELKIVLNTNDMEPKVRTVPDGFKLPTGTYARVIEFENGFNECGVYVELIHKDDIQKFTLSKIFPEYTEFEAPTLHFKGSGCKTTNTVFLISHSKSLENPSSVGTFRQHFMTISFDLAIHSYPFTKETSSTIHSLQGKTFGSEKKLIYYLSMIKKVDLVDSGVINEKLGAWKGSLPNLLYVAITRSKTPHIQIPNGQHDKCANNLYFQFPMSGN